MHGRQQIFFPGGGGKIQYKTRKYDNIYEIIMTI